MEERDAAGPSSERGQTGVHFRTRSETLLTAALSYRCWLADCVMVQWAHMPVQYDIIKEAKGPVATRASESAASSVSAAERAAAMSLEVGVAFVETKRNSSKEQQHKALIEAHTRFLEVPLQFSVDLKSARLVRLDCHCVCCVLQLGGRASDRQRRQQRSGRGRDKRHNAAVPGESTLFPAFGPRMDD